MDKRKFNESWKWVLEILIIGLWALWVGKSYFDFDPFVYPLGREFLSTIQTHHLWQNLKDCGTCAFWFGAERGGFPAFADIHSSVLNPLVALATLLFGVINGSKIILLGSLWLAGIAQWWIARSLKVSNMARLWTSLLAVSGGHLASRMELGALNVVVATAMGSLAVAALIALYVSKRRKNIWLLGITTGATILGGSGYMQAGFIALLPSTLFFLLDKDFKFNKLLKEYGKSAIIALLIAAPLIIPFFNFYSNFVKNVDPEFGAAQPLKYFVLNLVISEHGFYTTHILEKLPFPHLYVLFIGWLPVLLALNGIRSYKSFNKSIFGFLLTGIILIFLTASAITLKFLAQFIPAIAGIRHSPQIAGLAIPLILAFAAVGFDSVWNWAWPTISLNFSRRNLLFSANILLIVLIVLNLKDTKEYAQTWYITDRYPTENLFLISELKTPNLQWVNTPYGEHFFIEPAVAEGLKLSPGILAFRWKDREFPEPELVADRIGPPTEDSILLEEINGIPIYATNSDPYAAIYFPDETFSECEATGTGGIIKVNCDSDRAGVLIVREYRVGGWQASINNKPATLMDSDWLRLNAPQGENKFLFNYKPIDVPIGIALGVVGWLIVIFMILQNPVNQFISRYLKKNRRET